MPRVSNGDAEIFYEVLGNGPPVILLHPFPANHEIWLPAAEALVSRYQVILPDLRGHGDSEVGEGPATMAKQAADLQRLLDHAGVGRAILAGNSLGGYVLFEFWRKHRGRVAGLALFNTKAQPDTPAARAARLQSAEEVAVRGSEPFIEAMLPRLLGESTRRARPDLVEAVREMMLKMSRDDIAQVQKGMAERPDSVPTLKTINVPTLVVTGDEDVLTGLPDAELMHQHIARSQLKVIARAGHYAPWEQPEEVGKLLRQFVDGLS